MGKNKDQVFEKNSNIPQPETPPISQENAKIRALYEKHVSAEGNEFLRIVAKKMKCSIKDAYFLTDFLYATSPKEKVKKYS